VCKGVPWREKVLHLQCPHAQQKWTWPSCQTCCPNGGGNVASMYNYLSICGYETERKKKLRSLIHILNFFQIWSHSDSFLAVISALYAKFLIVMGLAFPMTEVISNHVTSSSYLVTKKILQ
jgi:hypothetical protein